MRPLIRFAAGLRPSDEQLMWRVRQSDDTDAFEELVGRWHAPLHALGTRMLGDATAAEDVVQEVFQRLHQHRHRYEPAARFSTYLWRIALNRCHDELRRRASRATWITDPLAPHDNLGTPEVTPALSLASPTPGPDEIVGNHEDWALVRQALQGLSPPLRATVVLRHYHDLKLREIAEVLEVPEGTVCSRLAEALDQLARVLGPGLRASPDGPASPSHPFSPRSTRPLPRPRHD
ncbi:MAG: sigma-70 family RNA polymerase sigma factor [Verrucomicrobiales bacterium]|nr:sigma-70 family RNA polymerase sigma factor [Verrucomicrobiales bacterium]